MKRFLQITQWLLDEQDSPYAWFKCLGCYNKFSLYQTESWNFCPKCGNQLETITREIKRNPYSPLIEYFGAPRFDLVVEIKSSFFDEKDEWEKDIWQSRNGDFKHQIGYLKSFKTKGIERRFKLIPSRKLPLP